MITGLGSVPVPVADLDRALAFYRDTLGFTVREDRRLPDGTRRVAVAPTAAGPALALVRRADGHPPLAGLTLLTGDIQRTYAVLRERGVRFDGEPDMQAWGDWEVAFDDPDGNRFHLIQRHGSPR
ncbi:MAG: VOC family protein [Sphaerobacter sp.]|nr:VOC family protein [Sphaerobacter sp.]